MCWRSAEQHVPDFDLFLTCAEIARGQKIHEPGTSCNSNIVRTTMLALNTACQPQSPFSSAADGSKLCPYHPVSDEQGHHGYHGTASKNQSMTHTQIRILLPRAPYQRHIMMKSRGYMQTPGVNSFRLQFRYLTALLKHLAGLQAGIVFGWGCRQQTATPSLQLAQSAPS